MLFIPVVGIILMAIAVRDISRKLERPGIWRNFLFFLIFLIAGIIAGVMLAGGVSLTFTSLLNPFVALSSVAAVLIVGFVLLIIGVVFLRRGFRELSEAVGVRTFLTVGTLYFVGGILGLVGAVLTLILIGIFVLILAGLLFFIGDILLIVAFVRTPNEVVVKKP